jgi:hypothetical protein
MIMRGAEANHRICLFGACPKSTPLRVSLSSKGLVLIWGRVLVQDGYHDGYENPQTSPQRQRAD